MFSKEKSPKLIDKAYHVTIFVIRITLVIAIITGIFQQRWTVLFVSALTLILTFLPNIFEKKYKINLPIEFEIITVIFIYASIFLGEVHSYYERFFWWDAILHAGSAMALGFIGFTILYVLYKGDKIKAKPLTIALFTFFFAIGIGAVWEIFEFAMDQIFGLNMQKSGLIDTMWDLIVDTIGALIVSIAGYFYLKKNESFVFKRAINKFIEENKNIFQSN